MMNLLNGRVFIGACSSESEGLQQPMKVGQTGDIGCWRAERHRRANGRIEHPGGKDDRHARFSLDNDDLASGSPFGVKLPDLTAMQHVPAVVDFYGMADMGRMAPRLLSVEKMSFLLGPIAAENIGRSSQR
jgi:hypothetical protein